jgi:hypothetical protein
MDEITTIIISSDKEQIDNVKKLIEQEKNSVCSIHVFQRQLEPIEEAIWATIKNG